jgi:hypothetical protein
MTRLKQAHGPMISSQAGSSQEARFFDAGNCKHMIRIRSSVRCLPPVTRCNNTQATRSI